MNVSRARIVGVTVACLLLVLPAGSSLATGGLLDTSFGSGGTVLHANTSASRMSVAPDGKIVFASSDGSAFTAIRLNPDGTLDSTFDGDGRVSVDVSAGFDQGMAVAFAPGGKIVIAGHAGGDFGVIRLNDDGSLDPTFDGDGIFTQPRPASNRLELPSDVKVDALGRIVVGGESQAGLNGTSDFMLLRLTPAGVLDSTFDGDGIVRTDFALSNDGAFDIELNPDGTIVAAGRAYTSTWDAAFARYLDDGTLDPSFSGDGLLAFDLGGDEEVSRIAIAPGRGIAFALPFGTDFTTFRLRSDGTLDPAYSGDGRSDPIDFGGADDVSDVAVDAQGRVVVVGQSDVAGAVDWAVGRYDAAGTVDTDFGTAGRVPPAFDEGAAVNVALQPDGKILVAGPAARGATYGGGVARYLGDAAANAAPSASFTVTPSSGTTATSFAFDGTGSSDPDSDPLTYAWAFGDGGTATGSTATHRYVAPGTYTATLTVDDGQGHSASTTRSVTVSSEPPPPAPTESGSGGGSDLGGVGPSPPAPNRAPRAEFTFSAARSGRPVRFRSTSRDPDGEAITATWTFGDGGRSSGVAVRHTFSEPGAYRVTLTVSDPEGGTDTLTRIVQVAALPDLVVSALQGSLSSWTVGPGVSPIVSVGVRVANGVAVPGQVGVSLRLSPDSVLGGGNDRVLGTFGRSVSGQFGSVPFSVSASVLNGLAPGTYWLYAVVDPADSVAESNESNNRSSGRELTVTPRPLPDLVVSALQGSLSSWTVGPGVSPIVSVGVRVANGVAVPGQVGVSLRLSPDSVLGGGNDRVLGTFGRSVSGQFGSVPFSVSASVLNGLAPGTYWLYAVVDPADSVAESDESNNRSSGRELAVLSRPAPDLRIAGLSSDEAVMRDAPARLAFALQNDGTGASPSGARVEVFRSSDGRFSADDVSVWAGSSQPLEPGKRVQIRQSVGALWPAGTYWLFAVADPGNAVDELSETNNTASTRMVVKPFPRISVSVAGNGTGSVLGSGGGFIGQAYWLWRIECVGAGGSQGGACATEVRPGTVVRLVAPPDSLGTVFGAWTGCDRLGTGPQGASECEVVVGTESRAVGARFDPVVPARRITVSTSGDGRVIGSNGMESMATFGGSFVTVRGPIEILCGVTSLPMPALFGWAANDRCSVSYPLDRELLLWAIADGQSIAWSGCTSVTTIVLWDRPTSQCTIAAGTAAAAVSVAFTLVDKTLAVGVAFENVGAGEVPSSRVTSNVPGRVSMNGFSTSSVLACPFLCRADYQHGQTVELVADPQPGWLFVGWSGACSGAALTCTVEMTQARSVTATFRKDVKAPFTIVIQNHDYGIVLLSTGDICSSSSCTFSYTVGTKVVLTAVSNRFVGWAGCDSVAGTVCEKTVRAGQPILGAGAGGVTALFSAP